MVDLNYFFIAALLAAIVAVVFAKIAGQWLLRRFGFKVGTPWAHESTAQKTFALTAWVLGMLLLASTGWAFIEPYYPRETFIRLMTPKVAEKVRIVHVSDLHCDVEVRAEERLVTRIRALSPDVIVFTGDGVNSDAGIPRFRKTMRALSKIAPVYGVRGNWEVWWFKHMDSFARSDVHELNGNAARIRVKGQTLWIGGVAVDHEERLNSALKRMNRRDYTILLHHFPQAAAHVDGRVDLVLSGDTHGGQIALPVLGPLIRISRWNAPFIESGLHTLKKGTKLYVNNGIGMEGHGVPPARFSVPPEIAVIDLVPEKKPEQ